MEQWVRLNTSYIERFVGEHEYNQLKPAIQAAHRQLHVKSISRIPTDLTLVELEQIKSVAEKLQQLCDVLIVVGIGGSYLGTKAGIELFPAKEGYPKILFAGCHLSSRYMQELLQYVEKQEVALYVVSKSGGTLETSIIFRILRNYLEQRYGLTEARERIIVATGEKQNPLRQLAKEEGYLLLSIPNQVGGRFSVLTAVGLLPFAVVGIGIEEMLAGASDSARCFRHLPLENNDCYRYALLRNLFYRKGKTMELLVVYEPSLASFATWWQQLFGESEGKDQKGIFPTSVLYTSDLHSIGQYIQAGLKNMFETVIRVEQEAYSIQIPSTLSQQDKLADLDLDLAGKELSYINRAACEAVLLAHTEGGIPNLVIEVPTLTPYTFGQLVYFFQKACAISAFLMGVNPFNQPDVEAYKQRLEQILGKKR